MIESSPFFQFGLFLFQMSPFVFPLSISFLKVEIFRIPPPPKSRAFQILGLGQILFCIYPYPNWFLIPNVVTKTIEDKVHFKYNIACVCESQKQLHDQPIFVNQIQEYIRVFSKTFEKNGQGFPLENISQNKILGNTVIDEYKNCHLSVS